MAVDKPRSERSTESSDHGRPNAMQWVAAKLGLPRVLAIATAATGVAVLMPWACAPDVPREPVPREQTTKTQTAELTALGVQRVIPLRIVMPAYHCNNPPPTEMQFLGQCSACSDGTPYCGRNTADFRTIRSGLERANAILRPLGVTFYIQRIEKYLMPTFWKIDDKLTLLSWANQNVRDELKRALPALTDTTFSVLQPPYLIRSNWWSAANIRAGEAREIAVLVAEYSAGWDGRRPWGGASSLAADRVIWESPFGLAHELGHIVGLEHTMYPDGARDPEKQADLGSSDKANYWDLHYAVNAQGQNVYFSHRDAAAPYGNTALFPKHTWDVGGAAQNCKIDSLTCTLKCCVNGAMNLDAGTCVSGQFETIGTPGIAGLGFTFQGDNPALGIYRRGANAMMYITHSQECIKYGSFSESQAEQVKRILRSDIRIDDGSVEAPYALGYTAKRHVLGDYRNRWDFDRLDFDGDGKHDLAVWQPPGTVDVAAVCGDGICASTETPVSCAADCAATCGNGTCDAGESACPSDCGQFNVRLSSTGYATTITKYFGRAGDVPIPADYDGDGRTDMAVLRRGGLTTEDPFNSGFHWMWCRSSVNPLNPDCTNFGTLEWGWRDDVPLPGLEFDGDPSTREIAIYRPTDTRVHWTIIGQPSWGQVYVRFVGKRLVHLHGLYDSDNKTDVVVYEPELARFSMFLSTVNWDPAQAITRTFDSALISNPAAATDAGASAPAVRHGGVPLPAEKNGRRVLRVWDPYTANWHTNWDPLVSTAVDTIAWGAPGDVPLAGPIDRDGNGRTDLVVFRPTWNPPTVFICSPGASCGNNFPVAVPGASPRWITSAVPDLAGSGDNRGDILVVDPDQLLWRRFHSQTFSEQPTLSLGTHGAIVL